MALDDKMERKDKDGRKSALEVQYLKNRNSGKRKRTNLPQNSRIIQENFPELTDKSIQIERVCRVPTAMEEQRATSSYLSTIFQNTGDSLPQRGEQVIQGELGP